MSNVVVQKIRETNQPRPFLKETIDLLDGVRRRAFELFQRRGAVPGNDVADWLQAEREIFQVPSLELSENGSEFRLELALPGFEAEDMRIAALPDAVIVEADAVHHHRGNSGSIRLCEFGERRVFRQIPLPERVDVDRVSASLDKGVLHVRAPKLEVQKNKRAAA